MMDVFLVTTMVTMLVVVMVMTMVMISKIMVLLMFLYVVLPSRSVLIRHVSETGETDHEYDTLHMTRDEV